MRARNFVAHIKGRTQAEVLVVISYPGYSLSRECGNLPGLSLIWGQNVIASSGLCPWLLQGVMKEVQCTYNITDTALSVVRYSFRAFYGIQYL